LAKNYWQKIIGKKLLAKNYLQKIIGKKLLAKNYWEVPYKILKGKIASYIIIYTPPTIKFI